MAQSLNQFKQAPVKGELDLQVDLSTVSVQVDSTQVIPLVPGQAVTMVDSLGGVPKVIAAAADESDIFGFVNYSQKDAEFPAGASVEISAFSGNVMYMEAGAAIARNAKVMIVPTGQKVVTATSTNMVVGRAFDKATADTQLIRVYIDLPGTIL